MVQTFTRSEMYERTRFAPGGLKSGLEAVRETCGLPNFLVQLTASEDGVLRTNATSDLNEFSNTCTFDDFHSLILHCSEPHGRSLAVTFSSEADCARVSVTSTERAWLAQTVECLENQLQLKPFEQQKRQHRSMVRRYEVPELNQGQLAQLVTELTGWLGTSPPRLSMTSGPWDDASTAELACDELASVRLPDADLWVFFHTIGGFFDTTLLTIQLDARTQDGELSLTVMGQHNHVAECVRRIENSLQLRLARNAPQAIELPVPTKVTVTWLFKHVNWHWWPAAFLFLIAVFLFGMRVGQTDFGRSMLRGTGLWEDPSVTPPDTSKPPPSARVQDSRLQMHPLHPPSQTVLGQPSASAPQLPSPPFAAPSRAAASAP